uniref:Uncharacterized protein n=1 Tax=viral metagenome TaxID=1070528 RepID=A0A6M3LPY7_9ZZZZ
MEFPDGTRDRITLALPFEGFDISVEDNSIGKFPTEVRGEFVAMGQYRFDDHEGVAIYSLVALYGCECGLVCSLREQIRELEDEVDKRDEEGIRRSINSLKDSDFGW